jgi:hypothetical protein
MNAKEKGEPAMQTTLKECPGCRVAPRKPHDEDCDHAQCPDCGEQLFMHDCEHWPARAKGPNRPALWHGIDPRTEIAHSLNWWTDGRLYGVDYPVEDYNRVGFAIALKQIAWNPRTQRYDIGRINEAALDRAIANSY